MFNLLTESLIKYHSMDGNLKAPLPEVYAALMADKVIAFPGRCAHTSTTPGTPSWCNWAQWQCTGPAWTLRRKLPRSGPG